MQKLSRYKIYEIFLSFEKYGNEKIAWPCFQTTFHLHNEILFEVENILFQFIA